MGTREEGELEREETEEQERRGEKMGVARKKEEKIQEMGA